MRTVSKWLRRYRVEGGQGLLDRCSAPLSAPLRTDEARVAVIAALRRLRMTGAEIAETLAMPASTVSGILTRIGLGTLWRLEPLEPPNRYEKQRPGELVHVDVKKLGRIGPRVAGVGTALLFRLVHGFVVALPLCVRIGLALGWLRVRTGSVYPGMVMHVFNAAVLIAAVSLGQ